jgi:integrase
MAPQEVTERVLMRWSGAQDWQSETRHAVYSSFRLFFGFLARETGRPDISAGLEAIPRSPARPRPIPDALLDAALAAADDRVGLILRLAADMGLRCIEIARVHAQDISHDLLGPTLTVRGKGDRIRVVPMPIDLYRDVTRRLTVTGQWLFPGDDGGHLSARWVSKIGKRALPEPWTMHTLRHRFGTQSYAAEHDIIAV